MTTPLTEIVEQQKTFFDDIQVKFKDGVKKIFDIVPELQALSWKQYVPSFNDGEPCEFSLGELHFHFENDLTAEDDDIDDDESGRSSYDIKHDENLSEETKTFFTTFDKEFNQLESVLERVFGVNQKIRISRDGTIAKEDYDCE